MRILLFFLCSVVAMTFVGCQDRESEARVILNDTVLMVKQPEFNNFLILQEVNKLDNLPIEERKRKIKQVFAEREAILDKAIDNLNFIIGNYNDTKVASEAIEMMSGLQPYKIMFEQFSKISSENNKDVSSQGSMKMQRN